MAEESSDDTEVGEKNDSLIYKLKSKIQALQKGKAKSTSDEEEDEAGAEDDAAAKKKKKSKVIQIVIGVGLVLFLLSDYIIPTEEPAPVEGADSASFKRPERKKKPKTDEAAVAETPADTTAETPVADAPTDATTDTPAVDTPTTETPTDTPSDTIAIDTPATDTPVTDTPVTDTPADSSVTVTSEDVPTDTTTDTPVTDTPVDTTISDTPVDTPISTDTPIDTATIDTIDGGETTIPGDENITDQILQDLENQAKTAQPVEQKKEYVSPPDYEYRGRGLVYNCQGKHWACVDAPSYKTCEDNASSVKYLKKNVECHPFNVYETPKGCENMQNRMVSSSAKTAFCNE